MNSSSIKKIVPLAFLSFLLVSVISLGAIISVRDYSRDDRSQAAYPDNSINVSPSFNNISKGNSADKLFRINADLKNEVKKTSIERNTLRNSASNTQKTNLRRQVQERKKVVKELMESDPLAVISLKTETDKLKTELPAEFEKDFETETEVEGTISIHHGDDFQNKVAYNEHFLTTAQGNEIELHFVEPPPILEENTQIRAIGVQLEDQMVISPLNGEEIEIITPEKEVLGEATVYKVAVVMVNFEEDQSQPFTEDQIRKTTFANTDSTGANAYFQETSQGRYGLQGHLRTDGDIFGWYTVPRGEYCNYHQWSDAADELAVADGFQPTNYDSVVYAFPSVSTCDRRGYGSFAGEPARSWLIGHYQVGILIHELGHNFSLAHANSYSCTDGNGSFTSISTKCESNEYGDPFDVMGYNIDTPHQFNSFHKHQAKFLESDELKMITTSGEYTIGASELNSSYPLTLVIPSKHSRYSGGTEHFYYLEYRQKVGIFDSLFNSGMLLNGVAIRLGTEPGEESVWESQLIDATIDSLYPYPSFYDAPLQVGQTFVDRAEGIKITTLDANSMSARVKVELGPKECVRMPPEITLYTWPDWTLQGLGSNFVYSASIRNFDSSTCGDTSYTIDTIAPQGFSQEFTSVTLNLSPGKYHYPSLSMTVDPSVPLGSYPIEVRIKNNLDNTVITKTFLHHVVAIEPTPGPSPTASLTPTGTLTPTLPPPTLTPTGTITPSCGQRAKKADFNNNGQVDLTDYALLVREFLQDLAVYKADANCDNKVDLTDYAILVREFLR